MVNAATSASPSGWNLTTPRLVRHSPGKLASSARADVAAKISTLVAKMTFGMVTVVQQGGSELQSS
jgi:hypothetical protein